MKINSRISVFLRLPLAWSCWMGTSEEAKLAAWHLTLRSCFCGFGWQAMDYASSICLKYLQVHSWTWATGERERERECKSRLSASNGSLVFAVARTQPICLSLQMNALSIYRHWLDWCKVSRIKMKNVWQLLPPAEKPEACRRTWVVSGDLRFVVKSYSLCL